MGPESIRVRELLKDELSLILPLIEKHNSKIPPGELQRRLNVMMTRDYHCIAAFEAEHLVGVAGYWFGARFYCGEYMDVDNFVVDEAFRSQGVGAKMMNYLEEKARSLGCKIVVLDTYVTYAGAHKFYFRQGYEILGFHFKKDL
jgi:GNAT superfamily N-acetyltransferase